MLVPPLLVPSLLVPPLSVPPLLVLPLLVPPLLRFQALVPPLPRLQALVPMVQRHCIAFAIFWFALESFVFARCGSYKKAQDFTRAGVTVCACMRFACVIRSGYVRLGEDTT